jgi:hypothetical protein
MGHCTRGSNIKPSRKSPWQNSSEDFAISIVGLNVAICISEPLSIDFD